LKTKPSETSDSARSPLWTGTNKAKAYVTNLTAEEADAFQVIQLYRQRADAENVFDELKNQWGFAGFCWQKAAVGGKFASFLKPAYQRLEEWLKRTAPQLSLSMGKPPPWLLFDPVQPTSSAVT